MDFGIPQNLEVDVLKQFISQEGVDIDVSMELNLVVLVVCSVWYLVVQGSRVKGQGPRVLNLTPIGCHSPADETSSAGCH
mgnify:CR=1 FL=1